MKFYIYFFEGDEPKFSKTLTEADINACLDGYLDILDVTDPQNILRLADVDTWVSIDEVAYFHPENED